MRAVTPKVRLLVRPQVDRDAVYEYLKSIDGTEWMRNQNTKSPAELLIEFAGRLCYRSWKPGLNANVTKVREDSREYFSNLLASGHGSVLEHASFTFLFQDVSRVFTHELVRHRAGVAISQESMRYVRLTDIPFWMPEWAKDDLEFVEKANELLYRMEWFQEWMSSHFALDNEGVNFTFKKAMTSFMRRFAPDGVATSIVWTANIRALRHTITMRTDFAAEEEIRIIFNEVAEIMSRECPDLMQDFEKQYEKSDIPMWVPGARKV